MAEKNIINSNAEYTRDYGSLRGVDLTDHSPDAEKRYAYLENMYIDYEGGGCLESIPGFRKIARLGGKINRIFSHRCDGGDYLIIHSADKLYRIDASSPETSPVCIADGLKNTRSCGAHIGGRLFILDGKRFICVTEDGSILRSGDGGLSAYVPTTHINGERVEGRNLLTSEFYQQFTVRSPIDLSYATPTLTYIVTDYEQKLCAVSGIELNLSGELYIPAYASLGGEKYKVVEILDSAFEGKAGISYLYTSHSLKKIGNRAFEGCTALKSVVLSDTVEYIGIRAFGNCSSLEYLYIGKGLKKFGNNPLSGCTSLQQINYALSSEDFEAVENKPTLTNVTLKINQHYSSAKITVPLYGGVRKIMTVTCEGNSMEYFFNYSTQELEIDCPDRDTVLGRTITIYGHFSPSGEGFLSTELGKRVSGEEAILGCSIACSFDGRLFLSGNENLPGVVFYSADIESADTFPPYFSADNYFIDGSGGQGVGSLLPLGERLLVFSGDSMFYHTRETKGENKSYPANLIKSTSGEARDSCVFEGEAVFACNSGIYSADCDSADKVTISRLSEKIAPLLLAENTKEAKLCLWRGYLAVALGSRIFLADSRSKYKSGEGYLCEWYHLNGIGAYENDERVFAYSTRANEGYALHPKQGERTLMTVYSAKNSEGTFEYYTLEGGEKYAVEPTEEFAGGSFYPATEIFSLNGLLFFGTEGGHICLFNTDKRGALPPALENGIGIDREEYMRSMGGAIHPYYYSFDRHRVKYLLATVPDSCGIPYLEKSTVRASAVLKFKCMSDAELCVKVKTDKRGQKELCRIKSGALDFSSPDFSRLSLAPHGYSTVAIGEYERGWIDKQYILSSEDFRAPIGIHSLSYRYKIKGKIKNK